VNALLISVVMLAWTRIMHKESMIMLIKLKKCYVSN